MAEPKIFNLDEAFNVDLHYGESGWLNNYLKDFHENSDVDHYQVALDYVYERGYIDDTTYDQFNVGNFDGSTQSLSETIETGESSSTTSTSPATSTQATQLSDGSTDANESLLDNIKTIDDWNKLTEEERLDIANNITTLQHNDIEDQDLRNAIFDKVEETIKLEQSDSNLNNYNVNNLEEFDEMLSEYNSHDDFPNEATLDSVDPDVLKEYMEKNPDSSNSKIISEYFNKKDKFNEYMSENPNSYYTEDYNNTLNEFEEVLSTMKELEGIPNDYTFDSTNPDVLREYIEKYPDSNISKLIKDYLNRTSKDSVFGMPATNDELILYPTGIPINPRGLYYEEDEKDILVRDLSNLINNHIPSINKTISNCEQGLEENLCEETKKNLPNWSSFFTAMHVELGAIDKAIQYIESNVIWGAKKMAEGDSTPDPDVGLPRFPKIPSYSGGSYGGGYSSASTSNAINEINPLLNDPIVQTLLSSVLGVVTFREIVPLYQDLKTATTVNSSPTANYGLIGVEKYNGKYYYKVIEKETGKVYFVEINDKVKLDTNVNEVLEVKGNAMVLNSTNIGSENFVKLANNEEMFLVQNKVENQGINFANVLDSNDGKGYYIPISDTTEIISLDSITNESNK